MKLRLLFSTLICLLLLSGVSQAQSVGIIGSSTPTGWDSDTDMTPVPDSANLWTIDIHLIVGAAKFRQDDAWTVNWGAGDFPTGTGTQDGPDIPIPGEGDFTVTFNSATGAYKFVVASDIGLIGDATPGGWTDDTNMFRDPLDSNKYFLPVDLIIGSAKFRANDDWAVNWGALDFPSGVGVQNGDNIPIPAVGKYMVTFDKVTGAYSFEEIISFATIGLIGSATSGGWDTETPLVKDAGNPALWKANIVLIDGEAKFRANEGWAISWGDTLFPTGVGILGGPNIPVVAGEYQVSFNTETFDYSFLLIGNYGTIGIIGSATPGGWDTDTDLEQDPLDHSIWKKRLVLTAGEAKFRADDDWAVNWGSGDFPSGVGTQDAANIPVTPGDYKITFNSTTGAYSFELVVVFSTVGIIGTATPDLWNSDVDMTKDAVDEQLWYMNSMTLTDGEAKFRAEDAWTVNWGSVDFPSGTGTQDGANIPITGGTYKITLHAVSGEYSFSPPVSTLNLLDESSIRIAPNPVKDVLNIHISAAELQGETKLIVFNSLGAQVLTQTLNIQDVANVNVSKLVPGTYMVHLSNGKYIVGKKIVVVK